MILGKMTTLSALCSQLTVLFDVLDDDFCLDTYSFLQILDLLVMFILKTAHSEAQ